MECPNSGIICQIVRQLAQFCKKSPDKITEKEIRDYFLYVKNEKKWARASCTIAICGIKFFWEHTLKKIWSILGLVRRRLLHSNHRGDTGSTTIQAS
ncbi:MAG: phage integrase N-terminal SAM-like domain-containing protein [Candidatus Sabulitectum sp.]|nr:phage integrase N-terminal SAM-like domain-containing protein [Candidatus Sabulitectum sp.]